MTRYTVAHRARQDLDDIWDYIGIENHHPAAADRLLDTFCAKFALLAAHPLIG